ncbi:MAG: DNA cytosine methyltransferase [Bacteroidetes bacterium]|nr:DNA cytosine methyltransferase [Bacteroidota bacterium]
MNKNNKLKQVIIVSIFSGMDLLLYGMMIAGMKGAYAVEFNCHAANMHSFNFKDPNGNPLIRWVFVSAEEMKPKLKKLENEKLEKKRKKELRDHYIMNADGSAKRPETIQEVDGREIRKICEELYGKHIWIVLIGGPPCTDFTKLNVHNDGERNKLVFEYLRILKELNPDVAVMEEVPDILDKNHRDLYFDFLNQASKCGYNCAYQEMNALHYDGCQNRRRVITIMVNKSMGKMPVFPKPRPESAIRPGELFDIDYHFSGHFVDLIKNKNHWMCTVTSGSPSWFAKGDNVWPPTIQDKLVMQGLKSGMKYIIPEGTPIDQQHVAVGNGVPINLAYHIAKTIMEEIFELPVKNEY